MNLQLRGYLNPHQRRDLALLLRASNVGHRRRNINSFG